MGKDAKKKGRLRKALFWLSGSAIATSLLWAASQSKFHERLEGVTSYMGTTVSYISRNTGSWFYNHVHTDPAEALSDFKDIMENYEKEVKAGVFDKALSGFEKEIGKYRSEEAVVGKVNGKNPKEKLKETLDTLAKNMKPEEFRVEIDKYQTILSQYKPEEEKKKEAVESSFEAVNYMNQEGLNALRKEIDTILKKEGKLFIKNLDQILVSPKEQRLYAADQVRQTFSPEDEKEMLRSLMGYSDYKGEVVISLLPGLSPETSQKIEDYYVAQLREKLSTSKERVKTLVERLNLFEEPKKEGGGT